MSDSRFVEMIMQGYTEELEHCPNPLCKSKAIKLIRQETDNVAQCLVVCTVCKTTSPRSIKVCVSQLTEDMAASIGLAVCQVWNELERYNIGVKYVHNDDAQPCPFCKCTSIDMITEEDSQGGYSVFMCSRCKMGGAAYDFLPNSEAQKTQARAQALFAWNLLGITPKDNVQ